MNIEILQDNVLIEALKTETTAAGLYLPKGQNENRGTVIAVGNGRQMPDGKRAPMTVKTGDRVLYETNYAREVTIDGKKYHLILEQFINGIER